VDYSIDNVNVSDTGPVDFPEFVLCLESPWDVNKSKKLNMSLDLLSYMPNLFFPFGGFGQDFYENLTLMAQLDTEYRQLLNTTGIDTHKLLHQITFSCEQILDHCYFGYGTFIDGNTCCLLFFGDPEYGMAGKCFRTNNKNLNFTLKESSAQSGLVVKLTIKKICYQQLKLQYSQLSC
jgi:hypothetical protein